TFICRVGKEHQRTEFKCRKGVVGQEVFEGRRERLPGAVLQRADARRIVTFYDVPTGPAVQRFRQRIRYGVRAQKCRNFVNGLRLTWLTVDLLDERVHEQKQIWSRFLAITQQQPCAGRRRGQGPKRRGTRRRSVATRP